MRRRELPHHARWGHRCRREHDAPARRRVRRYGADDRAPRARPARTRRVRRAGRRDSAGPARRHRARGPRSGGVGPAARLLAHRDRRDVAGTAGRERRRADRVARARPRRERARPDCRRGGELRVPSVVASVDDSSPSVAVCDVGGGSTQLAVGSCAEEPSWVRSLDVGSLRLTRRAFGDDPPTNEGDRLGTSGDRPALRRPHAAAASRRVRDGRQRARARQARRAPPRRVPSSPSRCASCPSVRRAGSRRRSTCRRRARGRSPAGALLLASAQQLLGVPLEVARAGLREGVALSLLADAAVAA